MSYTQTISFSDEARDVIKENFSKGKWGYQKLSETISQLLIDFDKKKPNLEKLRKREKELVYRKGEIDEELKSIKIEGKKLKKLEKLKFEIGGEEKERLLQAYRITEKDKSKLLPQLRAYNNDYSKNLDIIEFKKLIKIARRKK